MKDSSLDDIAVLCSHVKVDPARYRVFARESKPDPAPIALTAVEPPPQWSEHKPVLALPRERWALRSICGSEGEAGKSVHNTQSLDRLKRQAIAVFAASGGAGATTVTATLARVYSREHQSIAILDGREDGLLPFYFGPKSGSHSNPAHFVHRNSLSAPIHILSGLQLQSLEEILTQRLLKLPDKVDRLLVDVWPAMEAAMQMELCGSGVCLVVAAPDLGSIVGAQRIERLLKEMSLPVTVAYVLNKFDETQSLHRDIYDWFSRRSPVAPVLTIHRTDEINEALSDGATVIDYAPNAKAAGDYVKLAAVVREISDAKLRASIA
jgi:cellulose biosynthesis protein BcsQ